MYLHYAIVWMILRLTWLTMPFNINLLSSIPTLKEVIYFAHVSCERPLGWDILHEVYPRAQQRHHDVTHRQIGHVKIRRTAHAPDNGDDENDEYVADDAEEHDERVWRALERHLPRRVIHGGRGRWYHREHFRRRERWYDNRFTYGTGA